MTWLKVSLTEEEFENDGSAKISRDIFAFLRNHPELENEFFSVKEHENNAGFFYYFYNAPKGNILDHLLEIGAIPCPEPSHHLERYIGSELLYDKFHRDTDY